LCPEAPALDSGWRRCAELRISALRRGGPSPRLPCSHARLGPFRMQSGLFTQLWRLQLARRRLRQRQPSQRRQIQLGKIYPRLIDPIFSELGGPFGQFAPALNALLRRGCWVFNLLKRPYGEPRRPCGLQSPVRARYRGDQFRPLPRQRFDSISLRGPLSPSLAVVSVRLSGANWKRQDAAKSTRMTQKIDIGVRANLAGGTY
jgi:hypothetical protein